MKTIDVLTVGKTYIRFQPIQTAPKRKTGVWNVVSMNGVSLGFVKWHGSWRQFAFFPAHSTLFERECLRAIANFCEIETTVHRGKMPRRLTAKQKAEG